MQVKDSVPHEIVLLAPGAGLIEGEFVRQEQDESLHLDSHGESDCHHGVVPDLQQAAAQLAFRDQSRGLCAVRSKRWTEA